MIKGAEILLITLVLIISAIGYFVHLVSKGLDISFSVLYILILLTLYVFLRNIKLNA